MKIIILSSNLHLIFSTEQKIFLEKIARVEYYTEPKTIQDILSLSDNEDKIVALDPDFFGWKITKEDIDFMKNVRAICLQTTGFDYIDIDYLRTKNIPVTNLRGFSTNAVAEQAIGIAFSLARRVPLVIRDGFQVDFDKYRGIELFGKNAGIIGLGRIGTRIAEITQGLGMNTCYWSKNTRDKRFMYSDLDRLISESDVLFYALAKNNETESILTDELLKKLKKSVIIVSIAHIDGTRFIKLSEERNIGGYGCDDQIGKIEDFTSNIMPGAELGWCTDECFQKNGIQWIEALELALKSEFPNQVN